MKKERQGLADAGDKMWDFTERFEFEMQLMGAGETRRPSWLRIGVMEWWADWVLLSAGHESWIVKIMDGDILPECWESSDNIGKHTQIYSDREEDSVPRSDTNS